MLSKHFVVVILSCSLVGCADPMYQQTPAAPPSASEIQGGCFANFKKFKEQSNCIEKGLNASGLSANPYAQEYLAYMQTLQEKVKNKALSEKSARAELAKKHNELRTRQQNELATYEQLETQRAILNAEILRQYQANQQGIREAYPTYVPVQSAPIVVNPAPQYQAPLPQQIYSPPNPQTTNCIMGRDRLQCVSSPQY